MARLHLVEIALQNCVYANMNEQQVRQIVQQMLSSGQFSVAKTPFHKHTGVDSPQFPFINLSDVPNSYVNSAGYNVVVNPSGTGLSFSPTTAPTKTTYVGYVTGTGSAGTPFPSGWTVASGSTGKYVITHNLNNTSYVVNAINNSSFGGGIPFLNNHNANSFEIWWYNISVTAGSITFTLNNTYFGFTLITA